MPKVTPELLAQCLADIESGKSTVAECLAANSAMREELRGLLEVVCSITPPPDALPAQSFRLRARASLIATIGSQRAERPRWWQTGWRGQSLVRVFGTPAVVVAMAVTFAVAGGGIVQASQDSLPGDPLYPVKTAIEEARLVLAISDEAKAETHLDIAAVRLDEVERARKAGNEEAARKATGALAVEVTRIDQHITKAGAGKAASHLSARLAVQLARQKAVEDGQSAGGDPARAKPTPGKEAAAIEAGSNGAGLPSQPAGEARPTSVGAAREATVSASAAFTEAINEVQRLATQDPTVDSYKSLQAKLDAADAALRRGQSEVAGHNLDAFLEELNALAKSGRLAASDYDALYSRYSVIMTSLGETPKSKREPPAAGQAVATPTRVRQNDATPGSRPESKPTSRDTLRGR